jgi:hypothetical protein
MSVEQLLFLVLFVLVPLFNVLARVLRKRRAPPPPVPRAEPELPAMRPLPRVITALPEPAPAPRATRPVGVPVAEPRRRTPYRLSARDVHRGMVLMTILGPCRALEPRAGRETEV